MKRLYIIPALVFVFLVSAIVLRWKTEAIISVPVYETVYTWSSHERHLTATNKAIHTIDRWTGIRYLKTYGASDFEGPTVMNNSEQFDNAIASIKKGSAWGRRLETIKRLANLYYSDHPEKEVRYIDIKSQDWLSLRATERIERLAKIKTTLAVTTWWLALAMALAGVGAVTFFDRRRSRKKASR